MAPALPRPTLFPLLTLSALLAALALPATLPAQAPAAAGARAAPAPGVPDSMADAILAALNSDEPTRRGRLLRQALAGGARGDSAETDRLLAGLHEQGAPFELASREGIGTAHALLHLVSRRTGRAALIHAGAGEETGRLRTLELLEAHPLGADSVTWPERAPADDAALAALVDERVAALARTGYFAGVVRIERGGKLVLERGYGLADREHDVPNSAASAIPIASIGKMFTATAIAQLVQAGRLRWDDTLARVLPEYPNAERARRITIRQLLGHRAGLGDLWSTPKRPTPRPYTGQLAAAAPVAWAPLAFEPGTRFQYSNEGFVVLAAVVEKLSGESFEDYLRRHVFLPAGMTATVFAGADDFVPHRAIGYRPAADDYLGIRAPRANWSFVGRAGGAGGEYTTAADLARFAAALRAGRLLDPALRDTLWIGRSPLPWDAAQRYGYGAILMQDAVGAIVGHGGGGSGSGMDNEFRFAADGRFTVVVLSNAEPPAASRLGAQLVKLLRAPAPPANRQ